MKRTLIAFFTCIFIIASSTGIVAEDKAQGEEKHASESHSDSHADHKNHLAVFVGATSLLGAHPTTDFTAGIDYERRLSTLMGVGVLLDFPMDIENSSYPIIAAATLNLHFGAFKVFAAPGIEALDGAIEFLIRLGVGYDFHLGNLTLTPTVAYDYVNSHSLVVYGLALGFGF